MLDLPPILERLAGDGWQGWLVVEAEQDPPLADPQEAFWVARRYLAGSGAVAHR
jgi:inosose dehydratase